MDGLRFFLLRSLYARPNEPAAVSAYVRHVLAEHLLAASSYEEIHGDLTEQLLDGLTDEQLRLCPADGVNSIAWLLWHVARCEDVGVNGLVVEGVQVLDREAWLSRLQVARRDIGTGMTGQEVAAFSAQVNLAALRAYWDRVGQRTQAVVLGLRREQLDEVPDQISLQQLVQQELLHDHVDDTLRAYGDRRRGWFLGHLALMHSYQHLYEAFTVRGLLGLRGL